MIGFRSTFNFAFVLIYFTWPLILLELQIAFIFLSHLQTKIPASRSWLLLFFSLHNLGTLPSKKWSWMNFPGIRWCYLCSANLPSGLVWNGIICRQVLYRRQLAADRMAPIPPTLLQSLDCCIERKIKDEEWLFNAKPTWHLSCLHNPIAHSTNG